MIGPGKAVDTNKWRVICPGILGSSSGATCPLSIDPATGEPYRAAFPQITPADQARVHARLLQELGLARVHAVVGVSLGGMQVLQFASLFPDNAARAVAISCTAKTTPATVAVRHIQRIAIMADPKYDNGNYDPSTVAGKPAEGMRVARELGLIYYRSREEFDSRFDWKPEGTPHFTRNSFQVEEWLRYNSRSFPTHFDPNCYLLLSKAADLMDIGNLDKTYQEGVLNIAADLLLIGVDTDYLTPPRELRSVHDLLAAHGRPVTFELIHSQFGHDAFLKEYDQIGAPLRRHLEKGLRDELIAEEHHTTGLSLP